MELEKTDDLSGCVATMVSDGETFVGVNIGKVDGRTPSWAGKMKVEGDIGEFGKTGKLFRKYVPVKKMMSTRDYHARHVRDRGKALQEGSREGTGLHHTA